MGVYCDYYRAPDRPTAVTALRWGPLTTQPGAPVFDAVDVKNLDPIVMLRTLAVAAHRRAGRGAP